MFDPALHPGSGHDESLPWSPPITLIGKKLVRRNNTALRDARQNLADAQREQDRMDHLLRKLHGLEQRSMEARRQAHQRPRSRELRHQCQEAARRVRSTRREIQQQTVRVASVDSVDQATDRVARLQQSLQDARALRQHRKALVDAFDDGLQDWNRAMTATWQSWAKRYGKAAFLEPLPGLITDIPMAVGIGKARFHHTAGDWAFREESQLYEPDGVTRSNPTVSIIA